MAEQSKDLDKASQRRMDAVAENDIAKGFRMRDIPEDIQDALRDEGIDPPLRVRYSRANPARRSDIAQEVQMRWFSDIQDPKVLSNAQVLKLVTERGEWSVEKQRRMDHLQDATTREMGRLWAEGLTPETTSFSADLVKAAERFRDLCRASKVEDVSALLERFDRWMSWSARSKDDLEWEGYDQGQEQAWLFEQAPGIEAMDLVAEIDDLRQKQERLLTLIEQRVELSELQLKHSRMFSNTAESRRDHAEEMAQLYWTCDRVDASGRPSGRLTPTFDELWNWPEAAVRWLLLEAFFFHHNVSDVARSYLGTFGFFTGARANTGSANSEESPAPPSSRTDGPPAGETPADSSAQPAATT